MERTTKSANSFFFLPAEPPFRGSGAIANAYVNETLRELGYEVHGHYGSPARDMTVADYLPLAVADRVRRIQSAPEAALSVYCDMGLTLYPLRRRPGHRNVVLFHGLAGLPGHWVGNPDIDSYWCNSSYSRGVLRSILAMPDWGRRRLLDPRAFRVASNVTLPLPCVEAPEGILADGSPELPAHVREAIDSGDLLGHCIMSEKLELWAGYSILVFLNELAIENGFGKRVRLFVGEPLYAQLQASLQQPPAQLPRLLQPLGRALEHLGITLDDLFIPVPMVVQSALFEIVRSCHFGLLYNWMPESFGFYPLESVFLGCPVYTNGIGNLRHLLPEGHGIRTLEVEGMAFGDLFSYRQAAQAIYRDVVEEPERTREECRLGADYIRSHYNREAMRRDIAARLDEMEGAGGEETGLDALSIRLSPVVRSWNPATRRLISDLGHRILSEDDTARVRDLLGRPCAEVGQGETPERIAQLDRLFAEGVLALEAC